MECWLKVFTVIGGYFDYSSGIPCRNYQEVPAKYPPITFNILIGSHQHILWLEELFCSRVISGSSFLYFITPVLPLPAPQPKPETTPPTDLYNSAFSTCHYYNAPWAHLPPPPPKVLTKPHEKSLKAVCGQQTKTKSTFSVSEYHSIWLSWNNCSVIFKLQLYKKQYVDSGLNDKLLGLEGRGRAEGVTKAAVGLAYPIMPHSQLYLPHQCSLFSHFFKSRFNSNNWYYETDSQLNLLEFLPQCCSLQCSSLY